MKGYRVKSTNRKQTWATSRRNVVITELYLTFVVKTHRIGSPFFLRWLTVSQEIETNTIMSMMDEEIETWNVQLESPWSVMKVRIKAVFSCLDHK